MHSWKYIMYRGMPLQVLRELQAAFCERIDLKGQQPAEFILLDKEAVSGWGALDASKYDLLNSGVVNGNVRLGQIPLPPRRDPQEVVAPLMLGQNFTEAHNMNVEQQRVVLNVHTLRPGYQAFKAYLASIALETDEKNNVKVQGDSGVPM